MIPSTRADVQLTPHFWLSEFERSETATRAGLRNEADAIQAANLRRLAEQGEEVRTLLGNVPILISSGLRTPSVNGLVKNLITPSQLQQLTPAIMVRLRQDGSAHMTGCAMDFTAPGFGSPRDIVRRLANSTLPFDQLIYEGTWVHYGIAEPGKQPRRQVLTAVFRTGQRTQYLRGLV